MKKRVVITGLGPITPVGTGKEAFWDSLKGGVSGIGPICSFDASEYPSKIAGELKDFNPGDYMGRKSAQRMDRFCQFAVAGAKLALEDAGFSTDEGLDKTVIDPYRAGVIVGSGIGGMSTIEEQNKVLIEKGHSRISPFMIPQIIPNIASGWISIIFGLKGPNFSTVTACSSASHAICMAYQLIESGCADICIAGGSEATITPLALSGFCSMKALSRRNDEPENASRPFDKERDGFVMSEGAGILILELLESAIEREAHVYAEICGYGMSSDAYHITAPEPEAEGAAKCMEMAIEMSGMKTESFKYINAHGTSTAYNDIAETKAIKRVFGSKAYELAVSSTKSMTGHMLGAAGGAEAIATALTVERGTVPPTINLENPDSECDLDYVPNACRSLEISGALSNSFGFGGHNATIAFCKWNETNCEDQRDP